jgi:hypothetical protein
VPVMRNSPGAQVNVTEGRVDETVSCTWQGRIARTKADRQHRVIWIGLGANSWRVFRGSRDVLTRGLGNPIWAES